MPIPRFLSGLFAESGPDTESPTATQDAGESDDSTTVIHECRACGTNVSAETNCCPVCNSDDIVRYSID